MMIQTNCNWSYIVISWSLFNVSVYNTKCTSYAPSSLDPWHIWSESVFWLSLYIWHILLWIPSVGPNWKMVWTIFAALAYNHEIFLHHCDILKWYAGCQTGVLEKHIQTESTNQVLVYCQDKRNRPNVKVFDQQSSLSEEKEALQEW